MLIPIDRCSLSGTCRASSTCAATAGAAALHGDDPPPQAAHEELQERRRAPVQLQTIRPPPLRSLRLLSLYHYISIINGSLIQNLKI